MASAARTKLPQNRGQCRGHGRAQCCRCCTSIRANQDGGATQHTNHCASYESTALFAMCQLPSVGVGTATLRSEASYPKNPESPDATGQIDE